MATQQEIHELIVKVTGASDVAQLTKLYEQEEATLRDLIRAQQAGLTLNAAQEAQMQRTASSMVANQQAIAKTQTATRGYQQNIQALGYAMNDFFSVQGSMSQRLGAIANNMPGVLAGFGSWGLALSALLPIIGMLLPQLGALAKLLGFEDLAEGLNRLEILKARIKELEGKKVRLAVDDYELRAALDHVDELNAAMAAFKAANSKTQFQQASGTAVKETLQEESGPGGEKAVRDLVKGSIIEALAAGNVKLNEARAEADRLEAAAKKADGQVDPETGLIDTLRPKILRDRAEPLRETERKERGAIEANAEPMTGDLFGKAKAGDVDAQKALAAHLRGAGRGGLAGSIEGSSPAALQAFDESESDFEKTNEKWQAFRKRVVDSRTKALHENAADVGEKALQALIDGAGREALAATLRARLRAKLASEGDVKASMLDAVSDEVVDHVIKGLTPHAVRKAREAKQGHDLADAAAADARDIGQGAKDRDELSKGLGDPFLANAEAKRIALERAPIKEGARDAARLKQQAQLQEAARKRLAQQGTEPGRAAELAAQLPAFLNQDIRRQMALARAQGFQGTDKQLLDQLGMGLAGAAAQGQGGAPAAGGGMRNIGVNAPAGFIPRAPIGVDAREPTRLGVTRRQHHTTRHQGKTTRKRRKGPTPNLRPGASQVGSGGSAGARNAATAVAIARADLARQQRANAANAAIGRARAEQDPKAAARQSAGSAAVKSAVGQQDARTAQRNASQQAIVQQFQQAGAQDKAQILALTQELGVIRKLMSATIQQGQANGAQVRKLLLNQRQIFNDNFPGTY